MIILGIDPGTERAGYGVIRTEGGRAAFIEAGLISVPSKDRSERLWHIKRGVDALIAKHAPALLAVEKLFFMKNTTTGMAVAEARGVILLAAHEGDVPTREYAPTEVKMAVAGYGHADKIAIQKMVRLILGARDLALIDDAADALAPPPSPRPPPPPP